MAVLELVPAKKTPEERLRDFATAYANNGGNYHKAYEEAGFAPNTVKQNAKKYLDKHHDYVMTVVRKTMGQDAAKLRTVLMRCIDDETVPWNNRLKAIEMSLKNSGIQRDIIVIEDNKAEQMSEEERKAEIQTLMQQLSDMAV